MPGKRDKPHEDLGRPSGEAPDVSWLSWSFEYDLMSILLLTFVIRLWATALWWNGEWFPNMWWS